jgi:Ca2+-transporting ATPase
MDTARVGGEFHTSATAGLDSEIVKERLVEYGTNELAEKKQRPSWMLLVDQFLSPMILVLISAAVVTAAIGHFKDTAIILAIVVFNGIVGFVQEYRAGQAMDALKRMSSPEARVVRDGEAARILAREIVPGDVILLEQGDIVTADMRLAEAPALRINEAALTGESEPVAKIVEALPEVSADTPAEQLNMVFRGTAVTQGRGRGIVVATGMATAVGNIAGLLQDDPDEVTPLQKRLGDLGKALAVAALAVSALVFATGALRGQDLQDSFLIAVSLAVAAIPEGLPAVVTISLALGARRMARRRVLVRRLPAVETLGSVTVICTDKTGTLTENRMLVERLWTPGGEYRVAGDGYAPDGTLEPSPSGDDFVVRAARIAAACNDAALVPPDSPQGAWVITGDPTDGALLAFAGKLGVAQGDLKASCPRVGELGFDARRRRMTTAHRLDPQAFSMEEEPNWLAVKGAIEAITPLLAAGEEAALAAAHEVAERYANEGYRVLVLADAAIETLPDHLEDAEHDLRLVGLVAMADPPRAAAAASIAACRAAGIRPIMITGDHPLTARAIARRLSMLGEDDESLTGDELAALSDEDFAERVGLVGVFARTNPEQKLRIVEALRRNGAVVAMTGDGVNDAPALLNADIGVAMGITGTDVSKDASDMILADDDFATIVDAVAEGRRIYANIRRFVRYLLTTNSAEVLVIVSAPFLGLPMPLLAIQILWINLVTDGAPALSLGLEPAHTNAMTHPPRGSDASILGDGLWQGALRIGLLMAGATLAVQFFAVESGWAWQTMVFSLLALMQLANALAVRSERESTFSLGFRSNLPLLLTVVVTAAIQLALVYVPALQPIFETEALGPQELLLVLVVTPLPFVAVEAEKWFARRREPRAGGPT